MKHRNLAFIAFPVFIFFLATNAWAKEEFRLRWGTYMTDSPTIAIEKDFATKIMQRTNGRVRIDTFYAESIGKGDELLTLAGRGGVDMATAAPGYYPNQLLFWRAYQTPFVFASPRQAIEVLMKSYEEIPVFKGEMDKMNIMWLFHQPNGDFWLSGKQQVTSIAQLKGKKVRSFGGDIPKGHAAIGAVPVSVPIQNIYESLQKGVLDYSYLPLPVGDAQKITEVGKYFTGPITAMSGHLIVIGKPAWNKLPKDIQEIFIDQAKVTQKAYIEWLDGAIQQSMTNMKAIGGIFNPMPPAELAKWKAATPDLLEIWAKDVEAKGQGEMARRVIKRWRELIK